MHDEAFTYSLAKLATKHSKRPFGHKYTGGNESNN